MQSPRLTLLLASMLVGGLFCQHSYGQEFRIETDVFVDDDKEPVVQTLTIFSDGVVYDFLRMGVEEITLFDRRRERLVLMDTKRKVKTELTMEDILAFVAAMKTHLNDAQRRYLLDSDLKLTIDNQELVLTNERVTYRVKGAKPKEPGAAMEYRQFADWYARLNAMRLGNLPPFARIRLNAELEAKGLIPERIERTITQKKGLGSVGQTLRSQHMVNWRLSNTDRKAMDRAGTCLAKYRAVSFRDYINLETKDPPQ